MRTIEELLGEVPALAGADARAPRRRSPAARRNQVFEPGERDHARGRAGGRVLRRSATGAVAIETDVPGRGAVTIETLARRRPARLVVAGAALPRRVRRARARRPTHVIAFDGACLRGKCDADPALGYDLLKLLSARVRRAPAGHAPAAARPLRRKAGAALSCRPPSASPTSSARPHDTWTLRLEPATRRRRRRFAPGSSRCSTRSAPARRRSRSARSAATARSCTRSAPSAR